VRKVNRVAIIQARTSSSRLPGKVLEPIGDTPMIEFMLRRVAGARRLDSIIVATSVDRSDDALAQTVMDCGFHCFRGDLLDVLRRFSGAAAESAADVVVRLTGDCPLIDVDIVDQAISTLIDNGLDYVSNVDPPTYPNGLDVEAMTRIALEKAHSQAVLPADREHVTPYIRRNKSLFRQANVRSQLDLSAIRWTVDYADDLALIRSLVATAQARAAAVPDRFDYLRALERLGAAGPRNAHARNESYSEGEIYS